jgi:hypothetical protein
MDELERYKDDLATIRELMTTYDEQPIVKHWAFYVWGVFVIAASLIHYRLSITTAIDTYGVIVRVWVPVLLLGGISETIAWAFHVRDAGLAFWTRRNKRLIAAYIPLTLTLLLLLVDAVPSGVHTGSILAAASVPLLLFAQLTYGSLYAEAFLLLAAGVVVRIADVATPETSLAAGCLAGAFYLVSGVHSKILSRRGRARRE